ncbi:hypothetical protein B0J13DRAFT_527899 [Dactylonectria estremocensis]|uniref:Uncharacterized protein n=1 Tax=Dactylonectria estremocensis TaxID=1079267 RepID=A0A9P9EGJ7_9HYPO|nr:hypothetical protein B0J13DRAFT_527899 [Dactylonectria estremocensis]
MEKTALISRVMSPWGANTVLDFVSAALKFLKPQIGCRRLGGCDDVISQFDDLVFRFNVGDDGKEVDGNLREQGHAQGREETTSLSKQNTTMGYMIPSLAERNLLPIGPVLEPARVHRKPENHRRIRVDDEKAIATKEKPHEREEHEPYDYGTDNWVLEFTYFFALLFLLCGGFGLLGYLIFTTYYRSPNAK